jgi:hypothetical protein
MQCVVASMLTGSTDSNSSNSGQSGRY